MKKFLSLILTAAMLASLVTLFQTSASAVAGPTLIDDGIEYFGSDYNAVPGDATGDREVNALDIIRMKLFIAGRLTKSEVTGTGADVNYDGRENAIDVLNIKLGLAGKINLSEKFARPDTSFKVDCVTVAGSNDLADYSIVVPAGTTLAENIHYAAEEMQNYLNTAIGVMLPLEYGVKSGAHAIIFALDTTDTLGYEGFTIETKEGDILITGGWMRGCMYATYQFLEDFIGLRFISNNYVYIYESNHIAIPDGFANTWIPALYYRNCGGTFDSSLTYSFPRKINSRESGGFSPENWSSDADTDQWRYGRFTGRQFANAHSFYVYENGKDSDGTVPQPCFTDDAKFEQLFNGLLYWTNWSASWNAKNVLDARIHQVSFSINDHQNYCSCRNCRVMARNEGTINGPYLAMVNKAADRFQEYYPGVKLFCIVYNHIAPKTVTVNDNVIVCYCGTGCNNHGIGTGACLGLTPLGANNVVDETEIPEWTRICKNLYFWYYSVNYHYFLAPCPNVLCEYTDLKYIIDAGFTGIYYEGGGGVTYNFEPLKAYLAARIQWETDMTYERYVYLLKEYLMIYYGDGWEYIYKYIVMQEEAGNAAGCFINNHDRPWNMYSETYIRENWHEMYNCLMTAFRMAVDDTQRLRIRELGLSIEFLGLSASYDTEYVNADAAAKAQYTAIYEDFYEYLKLHHITIFSDSTTYTLPETCNLDTSPMAQFYEDGYC